MTNRPVIAEDIATPRQVADVLNTSLMGLAQRRVEHVADGVGPDALPRNRPQVHQARLPGAVPVERHKRLSRPSHPQKDRGLDRTTHHGFVGGVL